MTTSTIETAPWEEYKPDIYGLDDLNYRCKARYVMTRPDTMLLAVRLEVREASFRHTTPVSFSLPEGIRVKYSALPALKFRENAVPVRGYALAATTEYQLSASRMSWMFFDSDNFDLVPYVPLVIAVCSANGIIRIDE